ncbi:MAG: hypothetical protein SVK08_00290 [Halobacteriota archaeon]|nr:hypothetical protein [Halobacteriota archaeon]
MGKKKQINRKIRARIILRMIVEKYTPIQEELRKKSQFWYWKCYRGVYSGKERAIMEDYPHLFATTSSGSVEFTVSSDMNLPGVQVEYTERFRPSRMIGTNLREINFEKTLKDGSIMDSLPLGRRTGISIEEHQLCARFAQFRLGMPQRWLENLADHDPKLASETLVQFIDEVVTPSKNFAKSLVDDIFRLNKFLIGKYRYVEDFLEDFPEFTEELEEFIQPAFLPAENVEPAISIRKEFLGD